MSDPILAGVLVGAVLFGIAAVVLSDIITSIICLSETSLLLAIYFYLAGAPIAGVFEAVVAAGLVTVLFLMMISLTDSETAVMPTGRKRAVVGFAAVLVLSVGVVVVTWMNPMITTRSPVPFEQALWTRRAIDVIGVAVLVFVGILGVIRLTAHHFEMTTDTHMSETTSSEEVDT